LLLNDNENEKSNHKLEYDQLKPKHDCTIEDQEKENKKHQTENLELKNENNLLLNKNKNEKNSHKLEYYHNLKILTIYDKLKDEHGFVIEDHEKENKKHQTENLELKNKINLLLKDKIKNKIA
jgi:hypothetical protein